MGSARSDLKQRPTLFAAARDGLGSARSDLKQRPTLFAAAQDGPHFIFFQISPPEASALAPSAMLAFDALTMTHPKITVLLLAAGHASRMRGGDKTLEPIAGTPLLVHIARQALNAGCACTVTLPALDHPRSRALSALEAEDHLGRLSRVAVPDRDLGMSASIRAGVASLPASCAGVMVLPADMPELTQADFETLTAQFQSADGPVLRACDKDHRPGHPVVFPRRCFDALTQLTGDRGARDLLRREDVHLCPLPGQRALVDLDTPEAWAEWRKTQR